MNKTETRHNWSAFLKIFGEQNLNRPTRLGVFEGEPPAMTDYWLEDGLPLRGIALDTRGSRAPEIEIMLGEADSPGARRLTHTAPNVRFLRFILSVSGEADGLDIECAEGSTTILRFENRD